MGNRWIAVAAGVLLMACPGLEGPPLPSSERQPVAPNAQPMSAPPGAGAPRLSEEELARLQRAHTRRNFGGHDARCPGGRTAYARNEGHAHGIPGALERAAPTEWSGDTVPIESPTPSQRVSQGGYMALRTFARAAEIRWFSDIDGELGRGAALSIPGWCLTAGTHRIEARAFVDSDMAALGAVEIVVQTTVEELEERRKTPNVRVECERDWVLVGRDPEVDLFVRNHGGGSAQSSTVTLAGPEIRSAAGDGWQCERRTSQNELECSFDRDIEGHESSEPLRVRLLTQKRASRVGVQIHASVSIPNEIERNDNDAEFVVRVIDEVPIVERLDKETFHFVEVEEDPVFAPRKRLTNRIDVGPVMVGVGERTMDAERGEVGVRVFWARQQHIPNIPRSAVTSHVRFFIEAVTSGDGNSVVARGRERGVGQVEQGHAFVVLAKDRQVWDIAQIVGRVEVDLPRSATRFEVPVREKGKTVRHRGAALRIVESTADSVSFRLSGAARRILDIRARSATGNVLRWVSGDQRYPDIPSEPGVYTLRAHGRIAAIELFVADDYTPLVYPFVLEPTWDRATVDLSRLSHVFAPFSMAEFKRDHEEGATAAVLRHASTDRYRYRDEPVLAKQLVSAFLVELRRINRQGTLMPGFRINVPKIPNLNDTFGHLIFALDRVHLRDGTIISPEMVSAVRANGGAKGRFRFKLPKYHYSDPAWAVYVWVGGLGAPNDAWHVFVDFPLGLEERTDVALIEGRLIHRIPKEVHWHAFPSTNAGERIETDTFAAQLLTASGRGVEVDVIRGGDRVVAVYELAGDLSRARTASKGIPNVPPSPAWTHLFRSRELDSHYAVAVSDEFDSVEYTLRFPVP